MGGKLFNLPRMPRAAYLEREARVRAYLDAKLDGRYRIPRYYAEKPDFGDMDVLVASRPDWDRVRAEIARESTYDFMSFNDLGNLLGRICRRFNLRLSSRGRPRPGNHRRC